MATTTISARKCRNLPSLATMKAAFVKNSFMIMAVSAAVTVIATGLQADTTAAIGAAVSLVSLKYQL